VDVLALLAKAKTRAAVAGYDASCNAVRWEQQPLDGEGVEVGGKGKAGGVSNVAIDGNNTLQIKAIKVVISTFEKRYRVWWAPRTRVER